MDDFAQAHITVVTSLRPRPEVELMFQEVIQVALANGRMPPHEAQSLSRKLMHLSSSYERRAGRGQTFASPSHTEGLQHGRCLGMASNLLFQVNLITMRPYRKVGLRLAKT